MQTPADLARQLASLPPEARPRVEDAVRSRLHLVLSEKAVPLFCLAAARYRDSLGGDPVSVARARAQLTAYGEVFLATCTASAPIPSATR